ncbi:divalent cation transporter [Oceanimonas sp. CHS3-5]|uniref:ZIP family metal transporter n=1 Tax=Oceanimonas sp. CHS3-5 TaxID=3068186 RepID=UPI00273FD787|nr:divalent cation transporter [Oceanimonas sp. CHS3-5]MDP5291897.1 divalent cation transporter [Oceanimonas sp. CHS3-5]
MTDVMMMIVFTLLAGLAMPAGALLARIERIHPDWLENELRHSVVAFGGGALLSAVALVLVPEGAARLTASSAALCFAGGGLAFMALDVLLDRFKTRAGQLAAMLSDFIPESLALGAAFAYGSKSGALLLAGLMALQNLPEGFNAYRELSATARPGNGRGRAVKSFVGMALLGPAAALAGYFWLAANPPLVSGIMLFAAGGILYSVFQDIAPQAVLERHWAPPMGAVLGFLLGILGHMLITHGA